LVRYSKSLPIQRRILVLEKLNNASHSDSSITISYADQSKSIVLTNSLVAKDVIEMCMASLSLSSAQWVLSANGVCLLGSQNMKKYVETKKITQFTLEIDDF